MTDSTAYHSCVHDHSDPQLSQTRKENPSSSQVDHSRQLKRTKNTIYSIGYRLGPSDIGQIEQVSSNLCKNSNTHNNAGITIAAPLLTVVLLGTHCKRPYMVPKGLDLLETETITKNEKTTVCHIYAYKWMNVQINIMYTNGKAKKSPVMSHTRDHQTKWPNK